jgi:UDP-GlcNAc:undecaprenyl-phosphate/decaprenyl-phosphate GlcNAc-1-phosphate transferase
MSRLDAFIIGFFVTMLLLLALRPVASAVGLLDHPGGRKTHVGVVPVIGGLCMYFGLLVAVAMVEEPFPGRVPLLMSAGLLVAVGAIDDRFDLPASVRLITQATVALILCLGAGLVAVDLGDFLFIGDIHLGIFALPFTVLVTISVINAFNMLDGMDGLAGSIALSSMTTCAIAALLFGSAAGLTLAMVSIAVVLAFLVFNFPMPFNRAMRTFMGDGGSTLMGFIVAWLGLLLSHGPDRILSPVTALWIAAVPLFDLFISFGRRLARRQSPLQPDREHFHHVLLRAGLSERQVLLAMVGASFVLGMTGILADRAGVHDGVLFFGLVGLGLLQYRAVHLPGRTKVSFGFGKESRSKSP